MTEARVTLLVSQTLEDPLRRMPLLLRHRSIIKQDLEGPVEVRPDLGAVVRGRRGKRLQKSTLQRWFNSWLEQAGLRQDAPGQARNRFTLHSMRRFAAKRWLESGLNIRQVQILLGHENLQTTILYLNYDLDEIQRAAVDVDFGIGVGTTPL